MFKGSGVLAAAIILVAAVAVAQGQELTLAKGGKDAPGRAGRHDSINLNAVAQGHGQLPKFTSERPLFFQWIVSQGQDKPKPATMGMAVDKSKAGGPYDLLYIDADLDGQLDDKPITGVAASQDGMVTAEFLLVPVKVNSADYYLDLHFTSQGDKAVMAAQPACWREGPLTVGGKGLWCTLIDSNVNGRFDDPCTRQAGDTIRIAPKDDKSYLDALTDCTTRNLGQYVQVDGAFYQVALGPDGAIVELTPARNVATGKLFVQGPVDAFSVTGPAGQFFCTGSGEGAVVPAGVYDLCRWQSNKKHADGSSWSAIGSGPSIARFKLKAGQEIGLPVLGPLQCQMRVMIDEGTVAQRFVGLRGEQVSLFKNGQPAPPPQLLLSTIEGKPQSLACQSRGDGTYVAALAEKVDAPIELRLSNQTAFEVAPFKHLVTPETLPDDLTNLCHGVVSDSDGQALADVAVRFYSRPPVDAALTPVRHLVCQTRTNCQGQFIISGTADKGSLIAHKPGLAAEWITQFDRDDYSLRLQASYSLKGTVVDEQGEPIEGAELRAVAWHEGNSILGMEPVEWLRARTNEEGVYELSDVPQATYSEFVVTAPGYGRTYTYIIDSNTFKFYPRSEGTITLPVEGRIEGRLTDAGGKGIAGRHVSAVRPPARDINGSGALTDRDGKFILREQPPGPCCVEASDPGRLFVTGQYEPNVTVEPGKTATIDLKAD